MVWWRVGWGVGIINKGWILPKIDIRVQKPSNLWNRNCKLLKVFKLKLNILSTMNEPSLAQDLRLDNEET